MRNSLLAALMAATALIPGAAMAQRGGADDEGGYNRRGDRQAAIAARIEMRQDAQVEQRPAPPEARPEPRERAQVQRQRFDRRDDSQPAGRGERAGRADGGQRFGRADRDGDDRRAVRRDDQVDAQATVTPALPPITLRNPHANPVDNRGDANGVRVTRGDARGTWHGNDGRVDDSRNNAGRGTDTRNDRDTWRGNGDRGGNDGRNAGNDWRGSYDRRNDHSWNRNWRQDNRYDWNRRRQYDRNAYHLPRYYAPYGWNRGYSRFSVGITLNAILFGRNYWIDDPYYYGLPEAYGPYRWVRYYNDALLVDIYSGQVVDTVYDIFW